MKRASTDLLLKRSLLCSLRQSTYLHTYMWLHSSSSGAFTACCDKDTARSKANIRTGLLVWRSPIIMCSAAFDACEVVLRNACGSYIRVTILFSRFTRTSDSAQLCQTLFPSRVNYFGRNAFKTCSSSATKHCIIASQSRGGIRGALCGTGEQVRKSKNSDFTNILSSTHMLPSMRDASRL